jgi:hypothetical protein
MAAKCPKCGCEPGEADKTCPKCGAPVGIKPATETIRKVSTAVMTVGAALVVLDFLSVIRTYVGTLLIGIGFIIYAFYQRDLARLSGEKKTLIFSIVIGVIATAAGVAFLILDLIRA